MAQPGLSALFTSGEPAYRYMGPIDMSSVGLKDAKRFYDLFMTGQSDKEYAKQSAQTKRAQGHLNFLDWYFPFRDE